MNNSSIPLSPFSCTYSSHVPEILYKLNCSIAVTTYQAGKVVFISAKDEDCTGNDIAKHIYCKREIFIDYFCVEAREFVGGIGIDATT